MRARQFWFLLTTALAAACFFIIRSANTFHAAMSILAAALLVASISFIVVRSRNKVRWPFISLPLALVVGGVGLSFVVSSGTIRTIITIITSLSVGAIIDVMLANAPAAAAGDPLPGRRLIYMVGHTTLITVFFLASALAAATTLLNIPQLIVSSSFVLALYIMSKSLTASMPHLEQSTGWGISALLIMGTLQIFIGLTTLPLHFIVVGGVTALCFYGLSGISRTHALGLLNASLILRYSITALFGIGIILATAQWI